MGVALDRIKALKTVIGEAVPKALLLELLTQHSPPIVSDKDFISYFSRLLMLFNRVGARLSTSRLNRETIVFLVLLYAKPPKLAFTYLDVDGAFRAEALLPKGKYRFLKDGLTEILGPDIVFENVRFGKTLWDDYVPVSGMYLVSNEPLEKYKPKFKVEGKRTWFVYEVDGNPIPFNVLHLLSLLS